MASAQHEQDGAYVADLTLVAACLAGDADALARFERDHLVPAERALRRAGYDAALVADALQLVRYRLLVATPEREAKLRTYRGRGSLSSWLRVTALRQARALLGPRVVTLDSAHAPGDAGDAPSLEAALVAREQGPRLRALVRAAIETLPDRPREALRLELVEGLPHHAIATLWGVHRTTIVRWIDEARASIAAAVRRSLRTELAIGASTAESLLHAFAGQDVSLASAFLPAP